MTVRHIPQAIANGEMHFRFVLAVQFQLLGKNSGFGCDPVYRDGCRGLGDLDISGDLRKDMRQSMGHERLDSYLLAAICSRSAPAF